MSGERLSQLAVLIARQANKCLAATLQAVPRNVPLRRFRRFRIRTIVTASRPFSVAANRSRSMSAGACHSLIQAAHFWRGAWPRYIKQQERVTYSRNAMKQADSLCLAEVNWASYSGATVAEHRGFSP